MWCSMPFRYRDVCISATVKSRKSSLHLTNRFPLPADLTVGDEWKPLLKGNHDEEMDLFTLSLSHVDFMFDGIPCQRSYGLGRRDQHKYRHGGTTHRASRHW